MYIWNVYSKRRLERVYLVQISIYCDLYFASITHKLATISLSSFDFAWFFKKNADINALILYASYTCSEPCQTAALHELWRAIFSLAYAVFCCTLYIYIYIYILYTFVLQLIINSTMYTIVPVCVLFSNFGNSNAVYIYFYPDKYTKFDLIKVLKLLAALT